MEKIIEFFISSSKTDIFALLGFIFGVIAYFPYLYEVVTKKSRPAFSTWFLWSFLTIITIIGQIKSGKIYPQTIMYAVLDPFVLICAVFFGIRSPFNIIDWIALIIGILACGIIYFFENHAFLGLTGSLVGVVIANIPIIKNVSQNPYAESLPAWIFFNIAGLCSLLSASIYFSGWIDVLTPCVYFVTCSISTGYLIYKRLSV